MSGKILVRIVVASAVGLVVTWILAALTSELLVDESGRLPRWTAFSLVLHGVLAIAPVTGGVVGGLLLRSAARPLCAGAAAVLFGALLAFRFFGWDARMSWEGVAAESLTLLAAALALFFSAGSSSDARRHAS